MEFKPQQLTSDASSNIFLTGAILLANIEMSGMTEYSLKAMIGAAIYMGFKLATDYFGERIKNKKNDKQL